MENQKWTKTERKMIAGACYSILQIRRELQITQEPLILDRMIKDGRKKEPPKSPQLSLFEVKK